MLIQTYKEEWAKHFEMIKGVIQGALGKKEIRIEHIGSTSVPGLAAKPIIDMDIVYPSDDAFGSIKSALRKIGYFHNGNQGIPGREVFKRAESVAKHKVLDVIPHHLYACPVDSEELNRHLVFRDYLRKNAAAREAYQKLKYKIAEETNQDRTAYALLKESKAKEFILFIVKLAKEKGKK